jgi:uncharacterized membrane protein
MTTSLGPVALAAVAFVGSHIALSSRTVRERLVGWLGERGFRGLYSVVAVALIIGLVLAYNAAPVVTLWTPPTVLRHLSLTIMPFACIFLIAGLTAPNPTAIGTAGERISAAGPRGIFKITRHPVMWAFALWGISHLLANGDGAGMILFGAITALALIGAGHIDTRKRQQLGPAWAAYRSATSFVPFAAWIGGRTQPSWREIGWLPVVIGLALYVALLLAHPWLFGVNPLSVG